MASRSFCLPSQVAAEQSVELEELSTSTSEEIIIPSPTLSVLEEFQVRLGLNNQVNSTVNGALRNYLASRLRLMYAAHCGIKLYS